MSHKLTNPYDTKFTNQKRLELERAVESYHDFDMYLAGISYITAMMAEHYGFETFTHEKIAAAADMTPRTYGRYLAKAREKVKLP
jgi:DNA-directed RNA polymerase specialized sigma24 family protein